jgi:hypothetical protein
MDMITNQFVIDSSSTGNYLAALVTEAQGIRGITVDQRAMRELIGEILGRVISSVLDYVIASARGNSQASTLTGMQGAADRLIYEVNQYGMGKEMSPGLAVDIINKVEKFWIIELSHVLPDLDADDVTVDAFAIDRRLGAVYIQMTYPETICSQPT